jgi:aspartokinase
MSTRIFAAYLNKYGVKARQVLLDVFLVSSDPNL